MKPTQICQNKMSIDKIIQGSKNLKISCTICLEKKIKALASFKKYARLAKTDI